MKQMLVVLDAVQRGGDTSVEVAEMTGLPVPHAAHHLHELLAAGLIRKTGRHRHFETKRGWLSRPADVYEPNEWSPA